MQPNFGQFVYPASHVGMQPPATQVAVSMVPVGQAPKQWPQCTGDVESTAHELPQVDSGGLQAETQPAVGEHTWPGEHEFPQPPQLASNDRSLSQPSFASWLQSSQPGWQAPIAHLPPE